ncbi:MAG: hypothetical protein IJZ39_11460 [Oscillospiraceae bacterium]|nr:hypothetical protein [Oscillospiraceae bacterium]
MALIGNDNYAKIYNFLKAQGLTDEGAVGTMANIKAESNGKPGNLQNTFEKKLGMTDAEYVAAVDAGTYTNFATDGAGFGICQWTFHTRKEALLGYVKKMAVSVADLEGQLLFMAHEMATNYKSMWNLLKTTTSIKEASDAVLTQYERPADQSDAAKAKRVAYAQEFYEKYAAHGKGQTEDELRALVVAIAEGWLGCNEADGSHKKIIDVYNGHKPLARGYKVKYDDEWCATYGSAVAIEAKLTSIIPTECGCEKHVQLFKDMGAWVEDDAYVPQRGDYVLYDWDDNGKGDCTGNTDHEGIVTECEDGVITVIEGNKKNAVGYRKLTVNARYIRGYGCPDYASIAAAAPGAAEPVNPAPAKKSVAELAQEVIAGKWGNGSDRKLRLTAAGHDYKAVQKRVNEILGTQKAAALEKVAQAVIRGDYGNGAARRKALEADGYDPDEVQALVNKLLKK